MKRSKILSRNVSYDLEWIWDSYVGPPIIHTDKNFANLKEARKKRDELKKLPANERRSNYLIIRITTTQTEVE
jgi:hypothetical protein